MRLLVAEELGTKFNTNVYTEMVTVPAQTTYSCQLAQSQRGNERTDGIISRY